jgi:hypothetical protein
MPWWRLVVIAFLIDFAMFTFVALGSVSMAPTDADGPTQVTAMVEMTLSHDLIPQIGWTVLACAIALWVTPRRLFALVAMALSLGHCVGDLVAD